MLPETLVTLICTLEKSGCCWAHAVGLQSSTAQSNPKKTAKVRIFFFISFLRVEPRAFYHCGRDLIGDRQWVDGRWRAPEWELLGRHPGSFVRVASTGLAGS